MSSKKQRAAKKVAAVVAKAPTKAVAAAAPKTAPRSRRVFPVGICHHRDENGTPDCNLGPNGGPGLITLKRANLCNPHEKIWQAAARLRYAAKRGTTPAVKAPVAETEATDPEQLEETLAASVSRFATPELAAKARAQRKNSQVAAAS